MCEKKRMNATFAKREEEERKKKKFDEEGSQSWLKHTHTPVMVLRVKFLWTWEDGVKKCHKKRERERDG